MAVRDVGAKGYMRSYMRCFLMTLEGDLDLALSSECMGVCVCLAVGRHACKKTAGRRKTAYLDVTHTPRRACSLRHMTLDLCPAALCAVPTRSAPAGHDAPARHAAPGDAAGHEASRK